VVLLLLVLMPTFPRPLRRADGDLHVIVFYQQSREKDAVLDYVERNAETISYLAPFWYGVLSDGSIKDASEGDLKEFAADKEIRLQPLIHNLTDEDKGSVDFLKAPETRRSLLNSIVELVERNDYPGISIDFQLVPNELKDELQAFMENLHEEMQQRNKMLTVNVIPHGSEQAAEKAAYDFHDLSRVSDAIILMAYDKHGFSPDIGPVSPMDWVREITEFAVEQTGDPQGLILGIPAYGYRWEVGANEKGKALPLSDIEEILEERGLEPQRTDTDIPHFTYTEDGTEYAVWYEDEESIKHKLDLAREKNLHGVAIWRVGFETLQFWRAIEEGVQR
jgi:spore germination protein YaaH